jgi:hypothetical protein
MPLLLNALHRTSLSKPGISTAQSATVSSSKSDELLPIEHENAFWHQEIRFGRKSELFFCSHTGLNLAHSIVATLSGHMCAHPEKGGKDLTSHLPTVFRQLRITTCLLHDFHHGCYAAQLQAASNNPIITYKFVQAMTAQVAPQSFELCIRQHCQNGAGIRKKRRITTAKAGPVARAE